MGSCIYCLGVIAIYTCCKGSDNALTYKCNYNFPSQYSHLQITNPPAISPLIIQQLPTGETEGSLILLSETHKSRHLRLFKLLLMSAALLSPVYLLRT